MKIARSLFIAMGLSCPIWADIQDTSSAVQGPPLQEVPRFQMLKHKVPSALEGIDFESLLPLVQMMMSGDEEQKARLPEAIVAALMKQGQVGGVNGEQVGVGMNEVLPLIQLLMMNGGPQNSALLAQMKTLFAGQVAPLAAGSNAVQAAPPVAHAGNAMAEALALMAAIQGVQKIGKAFNEEPPPLRVVPGAVPEPPATNLQVPTPRSDGAIATVFQKDGWITVYDAAGKVVSRQNTNGKLIGYTSDGYSVEEAGTVAMYNAQGKLINRQAKGE